MANISYWETADNLTFKNDEGSDFVSPATQQSLRSWKAPLWSPTFSSRCDNYPMWDRPDIFRTVNYQQTRNLNFTLPRVEFPAAQILPSGLLSMQLMKRTSPIIIPDKYLYHYNVQRVFALFMQFDTLLEHQIAAFTSMSLEKVRSAVEILWAAQILEKPENDWEYQEKLGTLWRLVRYSTNTKSYIDGMDNILKVCAFGNTNSDNIMTPPGGSGARSSVKHNLFSAEVMLRIAESCDNAVGVWGDLFGAENLFHKQLPNAEQRSSHADGAIVTKDGTVVLLEIVGAMSRKHGSLKKLIDKTASWIGVIANSHLDINVLFVDTTFGAESSAIINSLDIGIRKESPRYAPDNFTREKALSHIGVVGAGWWFPEDGCISQAGTRLMGYGIYKRDYQCFDQPDPKFSTSEQRKNVVINTITSLHNPSWILSDFKERSFV